MTMREYEKKTGRAWADTSGCVSPREFLHPEHMHPLLVDALSQTRFALERPMYFSRTPGGMLLHPSGDAVPPNSTAHSLRSYHRWGVDFADGSPDDRLALAVDWDANSGDAAALFDLYFEIEKMNLWRGVGLYPFWNRPGLHTDLRGDARGVSHRRARWYRDETGVYHRLTWRAYARAVGLRRWL